MLGLAFVLASLLRAAGGLLNPCRLPDRIQCNDLWDNVTGMQVESFSTSGLPAPQQFDAWMEWYGGAVDILPHHPPRTGFRAQRQIWQIGGCIPSRVQVPRARIERNITHVRGTQWTTGKSR